MTRLPTPFKAVVAPLKIIDVRGFREIEDKILLYGLSRGVQTPDLDDAVDMLSRKTFDITYDETLFVFPEGYEDLPDWSSEKWNVTQRFYEFEDRFETSEATDDEAVATLLSLGLDFRDERGNPLRCTTSFCRQAEAAAQGIMGKLPDRAAAELESWEKGLERAAKQHLQRKRNG